MNTDRKTYKAISYGGGVNSTAMALLLADRGEEFLMVFADTGAEYPETLEYLSYFEEATGFHIDVVRVGKVENLDCSNRGLLDYCEQRTLIPMRAYRWCTEKFKINPIEDYCLRNNVSHQFIGFDAGESRRAKTYLNLFYSKSYPLIEMGIDRQGCVEIIKAHGIKVPRKTGCWCCSFQAIANWKYLFENHPELWNAAREMESAVIDKRGGDQACTLWRNQKTLEDLAQRWTGDAEEGDNDDPSDSIPCGCYD